MNDYYYDALLNIKTAGTQKGFSHSIHYHRYEPTPYEVLEVLFQNYQLKRNGLVVDFGCGKGRLNFYINHFYQTAVVGIEMNPTFYSEAVENKKSYMMKHKNSLDRIQFLCCLAEEYEVSSEDDCFYFFNPFTIQIFMKVVNNILESVEEFPREIDLILYYPSEDYIYFLENHALFELKEEIIIPHLYEKNPNERFLNYRLRLT
ncbi:methyltransferase [Litchfieldia alkalitelluris]|uniref:methyltransferase n=1 Tax=Litchfieldia alkalitelluris TaxID=304268 RepID=UPI0009982EB2|nr:methyltransferase [Litchfieldia alkalitelluris]